MDERPSKSARKRAYQAIQELGDTLMLLPSPTLRRLPLGDALRDALRQAASIRSRSALRRQRQRVGKLLARDDVDAIRRALADLELVKRRDSELFHEAEAWRDRIVEGGRRGAAAFTEHLGRPAPEIDRLVRSLEACHDEAGRRTLVRRVFRAVHRELAPGLPHGAR